LPEKLENRPCVLVFFGKKARAGGRLMRLGFFATFLGQAKKWKKFIVMYSLFNHRTMPFCWEFQG
jgi:hypothetical protein